MDRFSGKGGRVCDVSRARGVPHPLMVDHQAPSVELFCHAAAPGAPVPAGTRRLQVHVFWRHGEKFYGVERNRFFPSYPIEAPPSGAQGEGDLSDQGRKRMRDLGAQLRADLILGREDGLGLPGDAPTDRAVYLYSCNPASKTERASTSNQRHWESLREVVAGLWPACPRPLEEMRVASGGAPLGADRVSEEEAHQIEKRFAAWSQYHRAVDEAVCSHPAVAPFVAEAVRAGSKDPVHDFQMRLMCSGAHGAALPGGLTGGVFRALSRADIEGWHCRNVFTQEEHARQGVQGRLLGAVTDALARAAGGGPLLPRPVYGGDLPAPPLLFLWSATDGHLGPLAAALQVPYAEFPRFGSYLVFELLRRQDGGGETFLRVSRDSEVIPAGLLRLPEAPGGLFAWRDVLGRLKRLAVDAEGRSPHRPVAPAEEEEEAVPEEKRPRILAPVNGRGAQA